MKAAFRAAGRSEEWRPADKRWRCVWCGSRVDVRLAAYPAARPDALDVIRAAALATRQPQPSRQEVQDALLALPSNPPLLAVRSFWRAYIDDPVIAQSRTSALQSTLAAISRALGRYHDEKAPRLSLEIWRPIMCWHAGGTAHELITMTWSEYKRGECR